MGSAPKFLTRYAQVGDEFLDSIATEDETRAFHHTPESNQVIGMLPDALPQNQKIQNFKSQ